MIQGSVSMKEMYKKKNRNLRKAMGIFLGIMILSIGGAMVINDNILNLSMVNGNMLMEKNIILSVFIIVAAVSLLMILYLLRKNLQREEKIYTSENLIGLLGDMYYAIYRINFLDNTYECIKTLPEWEKVLGKKGNFDQLAQLMQETSWPRTNDNYVERNKLDKMTRKTKKSYSYYGGEFMQKFGDEYKWVNTHIIKDGTLPVGESIWCFRLVDEEKRKELEATKILKDTLADAEAKDKNKTKFFSQMSHDMRTPLNAIIGFAQLAKEHEGNPECLMNYINKIDKSANQLLLLINDVLEYSKIGENIHQIESIRFNIKDLIEDVETTFKENAGKEHKSIITEVDVSHFNVVGDKNKLVKVLNNLISNSLKYTNEGDVVKVAVHEVDNLDQYQITIEDNGIGISEEFIQHIFEPYAREMRVVSQKDVVGTGLGMLIVKNLINIMKGDISIKSKADVGTKVSLTIPLEILEDDKDGAVQHGDHCVDKELEEKIFFNGKKILVAEDNQLNMEILYEVLKMRGVEVTKAWDGKEALEKFKESQDGYFDCILMDMYMPNMDGCLATKNIRDLDRKDSKTVPIFAVTANAFAEDINKTEAAGMNGHMSKPIDFHLLFQLMKKYMD